MGFWGSFGGLVLLAMLLGTVTTVVNTVLGLVKLDAMINKIPVIGANWGLVVSILMMKVLDLDVLAYWGITTAGNWGGWMTSIAGGAVIVSMGPVKDAVVAMIGKGFRA